MKNFSKIDSWFKIFNTTCLQSVSLTLKKWKEIKFLTMKKTLILTVRTKVQQKSYRVLIPNNYNYFGEIFSTFYTTVMNKTRNFLLSILS